ncbi:MAG: hypothetical protein MUO27_10170 [Sedimentisphaerales bacterium]|nr:hypothetical protein [Sedimentisphaerales bacterium]
MTAGTRLVYEIDTVGLSEGEKKDLSQKMITVLRRRIDPRGTLPIVWRPQGNTRFEIQVSPAAGPYASQDVQRMLKGTGILEFRVLPTTDPQTNPELDIDEITRYVEALKVKGPKYASDDKYVWCEVENIDEWKAAGPVVAPFGDKHYVLASNKENEVMLRSSGEEQWRLEKARPGTEYQTGRRAIDFALNERGGKLFYDITGKNINRPLCILLDGVAMSAPNIRSRISTQGQITGNFTQTEVADIVNKLNAGCLPAKLIEQPISVKVIQPPNKNKN